jgi:hypothetical protein
MTDSLYLLALVMLTSLLAWVLALRRGRLDGAALGPALVRLLEWVGLTAGFYVVNMLAGVAAVVLLGKLTGAFFSFYVNTDATLAVLSALQAVVFQWWRAESA